MLQHVQEALRRVPMLQPFDPCLHPLEAGSAQLRRGRLWAGVRTRVVVEGRCVDLELVEGQQKGVVWLEGIALRLPCDASEPTAGPQHAPDLAEGRRPAGHQLD